eukprot:TRINITY_DN1370_c0_g1_i1.p1 TRINITY_DN1370_c0_g1~~TRINITY_DN1370_c0_g1_i1.p1  ORF type:complete len:361 (-),score=87.13 TRINITY_DN1370_c0_g1_i1:245-1282(-)
MNNINNFCKSKNSTIPLSSMLNKRSRNEFESNDNVNFSGYASSGISSVIIDGLNANINDHLSSDDSSSGSDDDMNDEDDENDNDNNNNKNRKMYFNEPPLKRQKISHQNSSSSFNGEKSDLSFEKSQLPSSSCKNNNEEETVNIKKDGNERNQNSGKSEEQHHCYWENCNSSPFKEISELGKHILQEHIVTQKIENKKQKKRGYICKWENCKRNLKPFKGCYNLEHHIRYQHTKEKPFDCHICKAKFVQNSDLREHLKSIHKVVQPKPKKNSIRDSNKPSPSCHVSLTRRVPPVVNSKTFDKKKSLFKALYNNSLAHKNTHPSLQEFLKRPRALSLPPILLVEKK